MNETWNLDTIFAGGSHSPDLAQFLEDFSGRFTQLEQRPLPTTRPEWVSYLEALYDLNARTQHAISFITCLNSQDVNDAQARQLLGRVDQFSARLGTLWTQSSSAMADLPDAEWQLLLTEPTLAPVAFHLSEQRDNARQKMDAMRETLVNELATDGYHAWGRLYQHLTGRVTVPFQGKSYSLGQLQNLYMDAADRPTRQAAFETFENAWQEQSALCATALNYQAGFRLTLYKHRGWSSVWQEPLKNNRLTAETLAAMWDTIDRKSGKLLEYMAARAKMMEINQLHWYDTTAPVGENQRTFTYAQAADFVIDSINQFDPHIAQFCQMAVQERWVEAENRPGKRAGAYCTSLPLNQQSRIFMTYNGSYNGLLTLAHELGHGYHSWVMRDLPTGARRYTMSVAETASTFNELVVNSACLQQSQNPAEKIAILGAKLNDAVTFLMNIRARFEFETAFFAQRVHGPVSEEQLNDLMVSAQKLSYKDGLAQYHPLFWASKLHFFATQTPFYNFPYTFGFLFSNGVYAQAQAEGSSFSQKYVALLRDTGSMTTEQLAQKHLGVDLQKPAFWETAVDRVLSEVDQFLALV